MHSLTLQPIDALSGDVHLPGSKSMSNRALLLAALAEGETRLRNVLDSDDIRFMLQALEQLGVRIRTDGGEHVVTGCAGPLVVQALHANLDLGLAGTALRPLAAALTLGGGTFRLDGSHRMRERPVAHLVDGLRQLGADIRYVDKEGYPPLDVRGTGLHGGHVEMRGEISSQFLTSLLLGAPLADGPVHVSILGEQVSTPYLDVTMHMMRAFGAQVDHRRHQAFSVHPGGYVSPGTFLVEGDASSATYFLAAGAIRGRGVRVLGIGTDSVQGDVAFAEVLSTMGATVTRDADSVTVTPGRLHGVTLDLNHIPDAAMTASMPWRENCARLALRLKKDTTTLKSLPRSNSRPRPSTPTAITVSPCAFP
jgi:3-phosphoshikimate 1-carboxyvinyltransferase